MASYNEICRKPSAEACTWFFIKLVLICFASANGVLATQYTVGDSSGWNLGVDYNTWASQNTFKTGDSLLFSYGGIHSVVQVSEADYNACNTGNAISTGTGGNTEVKLQKEQTYYFICGVSSHCTSGMQLSVKVGATTSSSSTPTTITSPTTPSTPKSPSSTTTTTTTATPSSSTDTSLASPLIALQNLYLLTIFITLVSLTFPMFT